MKDENAKKAGGTGVGAVAGAAAGGIAGGAAAGAAVGAVAGAVMGHKAADPAVEEKYWRDNYSTRPYAKKDASFEDYSPAYRAGVDSYSRNPGRSWDEVEPEMSRNWGSTRGQSSLEWDHARPAARDAWDRLSNMTERAIPGDSDKDGR